jgi:hypothetical protein
MNIQMIDAPMGEGKAELFKETKSSSKLHEDIPTLASSAMIVEVNISNWTGRKKDKAASKDVTTRNNANDGVASVHKALLADNSDLRAIQQHVTAIRAAHAHMTMPWSNSGLRLLPTAQFFKYQQAMTDMQNEFWRLVKEFLSKYNDAVIDVQALLGNLFSRDDYPTLEALERKFGFSISYDDVPTGDFRVALPAEAIAELTTNRNADHQNNLERAMNDVWTRLYKALTNMSDRLDYGSKEEKKVFRDTLVSNVIDMIELLRVCNVTNSTQMSAMADSLEEAMSGVTPDALREDDYFRAETKAAVDAAIKSLPSLDI